MANLTRSDRRINRKTILESLQEETGSSGGSAAAPRVKAYCNDPVGATPEEFGFVGGLTLRRFYIDPSKPIDAERASLWFEIVKRLGKPGVANPGGWDGSADVKKLQAIAEEAA
ncbi:hypothetical protein ACVNIS_00735 [Sphaerotilaceae bacterium SBD11-9]